MGIAGNIFRGAKKGISAAKFAGKIGGGTTSRFAKGLFSFASPSSYAKDVRKLTSGVRQIKNLSSKHTSTAIRKSAAASASLLGKGSGIVMAGRVLTGRNPVKNKKGRFDVPFMPI